MKFSVNHWSTDYHPAEEPFLTWMSDYHYDEYLLNHEYVERNKLVVVYTDVDMSLSFAVTCPREFVEFHAPCLLYNAKNSEFVFNEDAEWGTIGVKFLDYSEENIGIWYYDQHEDIFIKTYKTEDGKFCFVDGSEKQR